MLIFLQDGYGVEEGQSIHPYYPLHFYLQVTPKNTVQA